MSDYATSSAVSLWLRCANINVGGISVLILCTSYDVVFLYFGTKFPKHTYLAWF